MVKMYFINAKNFNCRDRKSKKEMLKRTGIADLNVEIKKRRWKINTWIICFGEIPRSLKWTPPGKRKPGRPNGTWRRTLET